MTGCYEDFLCCYDFYAVLNIFRSYRYGANASVAIEKIATGKKDYHKYSLYITVCIATTYH